MRKVINAVKKGRVVVSLLMAMIALGLISSSSLASDQITIKGSTTVLPIAQRTAEVFMSKNPQINISVQGGGSGVGIAALVDGTTDIADASRAIKDKELKKAVSRGITPKANVVAMDGLAVVVNSSNNLENLTIQQIKDIYTGKISNWSEVGGSGGQIVVISRDSASGTYEAFNELALSKARVRADALLSASNQAVAQTVAREPLVM
jgi:phosphate transport system substrate-binding protein